MSGLVSKLTSDVAAYCLSVPINHGSIAIIVSPPSDVIWRNRVGRHPDQLAQAKGVFMKRLLVLSFLLLFPSGVLAEPHDGDYNIFPGNAVALSPPLQIARIIYKKGYLGELVPVEDSEVIPRLKNVMSLDFIIGSNRYRFTHNAPTVLRLKKALQAIAKIRNPQTRAWVHLTFYAGYSFRDGVHRVSGFDAFLN